MPERGFAADRREKHRCVQCALHDRSTAARRPGRDADVRLDHDGWSEVSLSSEVFACVQDSVWTPPLFLAGGGCAASAFCMDADISAHMEPAASSLTRRRGREEGGVPRFRRDDAPARCGIHRPPRLEAGAKPPRSSGQNPHSSPWESASRRCEARSGRCPGGTARLGHPALKWVEAASSFGAERFGRVPARDDRLCPELMAD